jgi:tetratricopeptide (TPR) repeat protein/DNA-binding XRE family transcriptional regulator
MNDSLADVGRVLHEIRLRRGWSQEELAQKAGVPVAAIIAYESESPVLPSRIALRVFDALPPDPRDQSLFDAPMPGFPSSPPGWLMNEMEVRMHEFTAAFAIDKRDFSQALAHLDRALSIDPCKERSGQLLFSKAAVFAELGYEEQALETLAQAQGHLDASAEPNLWLRMRLEQLHLLCQVQRFDEAAALEEETLDLAAHVGGDQERFEARYLAGRIAGGSGRALESLPLLQEVRERLSADGRTREAAAVSLDLAALFIELQDPAALTALARDLEALSRRKKLASSVRSRIKLFCWWVRGDRPDAERTRTLAREIRRAVGRLRRPYQLPSKGNDALPSWWTASS